MTYDGFTKYDAHVAQNYEADRENEQHWRAEQEFMAAYVRRTRLGSLLDVPVGTGRFFEYYAQADSVTGVDISPDMLSVATEKAKSLNLRHLCLTREDATALSFDSGSFDTIVCFRLVHLLPPDLVPNLFSELARVSRGNLLVQVYASMPRRFRLFRLFASVVLKPFIRRYESSNLPWSHIQSYAHTTSFLLGTATACGLKLIRKDVLCSYTGNLSVDVLEFRK